MPESRPRSRWALPIVLAALGLTGWHFLGHVFAAPPPFEGLAQATVTLSSPVERVVPGQRGGRGPYDVFRWKGGEAMLEDLCFLSACATPPGLAKLRAGDRVTLWIGSGEVWQVEKDGSPVLRYQAASTSFANAMHRRTLVELPLWLSSVGLLVFLLLRRRRSAPAPESGDASPRPARRVMRVKFRVSVNGKPVVGGEDEELPKRLN